jgi:hypothetical protein
MNKGLEEFLDAAKRQGVAEESVVALLRGRGWPKDEVYRALADHYESESGVVVPPYKPSGSAKDAFLYLLSFSMLGTWTIALGSILFVLIDRWIKDPLNPPSNAYYLSYQVANSMACVIVGLPVYLLTMRYILGELKAHPEKLDSPVRKWLTYLALLVAAGVVVGDVIAFLTYFLRGDLSARFVWKIAAVLVIAGGVFWYYFGSLQRRAQHKGHE